MIKTAHLKTASEKQPTPQITDEINTCHPSFILRLFRKRGYTITLNDARSALQRCHTINITTDSDDKIFDTIKKHFVDSQGGELESSNE